MLIEEIRFLFRDEQKDSSKKYGEFHKFRERWDFEDVSKRELGGIKKTINVNSLEDVV